MMHGRRYVTAVIALLLAGAACQNPERAAKDAAASEAASGGRELTADQVRAAVLVDADFGDEDLTAEDGAMLPLAGYAETLVPSDPTCKGVLEALGIENASIAPKAFASTHIATSMDAEGSYDAVVAGYAPGDADRLMRHLRSALHGCPEFTTPSKVGELKYTVTKDDHDYGKPGDDSMAYRIVVTAPDEKDPFEVEGVWWRDGTALGHVAGYVNGDLPNAGIDSEHVRMQAEKLHAIVVANQATPAAPDTGDPTAGRAVETG